MAEQKGTRRRESSSRRYASRAEVSPTRRQSVRSSRKAAERPSYATVQRASYQQYSRNSGNYVSRKQGLSKGAKIAIVVVLLAVLAAAIGGVVWMLQKNTINEGFSGGKTNDELVAIDAELTGTKIFTEPFTMLLLGSDARADDETMGARTDTNILCRIDPTVNKVSLLSIPRDTMITISGAGQNKFNAAYFYGGVAGTIKAVKDLCGVDVDHYAEIDFEGLVDLIDAVGGIDVQVDELIDDPDAGDVVIQPGLQHLDGEAALVFSRSRAYIDGDYTRQANQRKVIMALAYKMLESPATELVGIIQASTKFLTTDMTLDDILSVADQMRHNNDYPITIYSANIPSYPSDVNGVSYVIADQFELPGMMRVFNEGGDIGAYGKVEETPNDANATGAGVVDNGAYSANDGTGTSGYSNTGTGTGTGAGYYNNTGNAA